MLTKDYSKTNFTIEKPTRELVQLGCLQRIADALETHLPVLAKNHAQLITDHDSYKRWYYEQRERVASRDRTIAALRGQITKLKKKGGAAWPRPKRRSHA